MHMADWWAYTQDDITLHDTKSDAMDWHGVTDTQRFADGCYTGVDRDGGAVDLVRSDRLDAYNHGCP